MPWVRAQIAAFPHYGIAGMLPNRSGGLLVRLSRPTLRCGPYVLCSCPRLCFFAFRLSCDPCLLLASSFSRSSSAMQRTDHILGFTKTPSTTEAFSMAPCTAEDFDPNSIFELVGLNRETFGITSLRPCANRASPRMLMSVLGTFVVSHFVPLPWLLNDPCKFVH